MNSALVEICTRLARHASFGECRPLVAALSDLGDVSSRSSSGPSAKSFLDVGAALRYHHIAPLIIAAINEANLQHEIEPALLAAIDRARARQPSEAALLQAFDEMRQALHAGGIDVVLLKGIHFAHRLYGGYARRPQYDLDVLVRAGDRAGARRVLTRIGYRRDTSDLHSETLVRDAAGPGATALEAAEESKADVHGWLRRAPAYQIDERAVWRDVRTVRFGSVEVLTLSDEYNLVLLGLSCFEDLGQGMAKIKQLLDTLLFLRDVDVSMDWEAFFGRRTREGVDAILAHVFALVVLGFDAWDQVPRLAEVLTARAGRTAGASRALAMTLITAPRKHPANLSWFARVYPGNMWFYLAWFWIAGFPGNAGDLKLGRVWRTVGAARRR